MESPHAAMHERGLYDVPSPRGGEGMIHGELELCDCGHVLRRTSLGGFVNPDLNDSIQCKNPECGVFWIKRIVSEVVKE